MQEELETQEKKGIQMPHTYVIIFGIVLIAWLLTLVIPAGKFSTEEVEYETGDGGTETQEVLQQDSFRYMHPLEQDTLRSELEDLSQDEETLANLQVDEEDLTQVLDENQTLSLNQLAEIGLSEENLYDLYGESIYDTSENLSKTANVWGTEDHYGFGVFNYLFEGLVEGDRFSAAIGIVAMLLVVGGAFGIIMKTGAIDAGIYAFLRNARGMQDLAIPLIFVAFSFMGATFGASEEVIAFSIIIVPFTIALGYDSITAVTITIAAAEIGNATSWMSPFSIAIAQGIAGLPALSGAGFRIIMWVVITLLSCGYTVRYARKIKANPTKSITYKSDGFFRENLANQTEEERPFTLGHKVILLELLIGLGWIVYGVMAQGFTIPEMASQFFVIGLGAGAIAVILRVNNMRINDVANAFQDGVADLAPTAAVVGMAQGILLVLGGSDADSYSALNTILHSVGELLSGVPSMIAAWFMYIFQSLFNLVVTSNSGQAALTMPIMAPLADLAGVTRQVAVLCFQLGAGFVDAFTPVSASLIGVLGVAHMDWSQWAKFQIKMQGFLFLIGSAFVIGAVIIGYQ
ncbi:C4-dicarboxylate anaerobic carrier [Tetragenococcus muriaticus PMC-11-5]|uniref:C4-dicarboxylate anaerobic carrier n=1 Tax=Tetragenococcus muriaticus PMC-11-5 TaxID=1302649 RepID=A0A091C8T5_9ENTE|nr:putative basic amino acid antiporter YfcC [Tetragenococcus muriaticus]KFN93384.1 C4-dicarboxylate anaerobic carrier [Tetragenococcus muriaticus PMC-11-5]